MRDKGGRKLEQKMPMSFSPGTCAGRFGEGIFIPPQCNPAVGRR